MKHKKWKDWRSNPQTNIEERVDTLFKQLEHLYGTRGFILRASKLDAIDLIQAEDIRDRMLALQKLLEEDPTLTSMEPGIDLVTVLDRLEDIAADRYARRAVEKQLQQRVQEKMEVRYNDYLQDIKREVVKKQSSNHENAQTLKKLGHLEKMERDGFRVSAFERLRPGRIEEVIGQDTALRALIAKLSTPFSQHIILYGPPGVGKTTCARLALDIAKTRIGSAFREDAPFIEVDGTTLRWDPRESTNPLLGSVHDPIYQGARRELAEEGIPEPKLGLVSSAHGGILFIDEIGEMDSYLQNKLLKVMEDKRVFFESSYFDPADERVPQYIKKIFTEGVPADFLLIGATTRDPEEISPAFRSRCMEVYFEPLGPAHIEEIIIISADKLGIKIAPGVGQIISQYCHDGRGANKILLDAYGLAMHLGGGNPVQIESDQVYEAIQNSRLSPSIRNRAAEEPEVGRIYGLGLSGYLGSLVELEAIAFPAAGERGQIRFNDTAGSMTRDSVANAASVFRKENGHSLDEYDVHINIIGGGKVDGPSAGAAIFLAITSAVFNHPLCQDVAISGEISIHGRIKPVGGIYQKIIGAQKAGIKKVLIPSDNQPDIPTGVKGIEIIPIKHIHQAYPLVFAGIDNWPVGGLGQSASR